MEEGQQESRGLWSRRAFWIGLLVLLAAAGAYFLSRGPRGVRVTKEILRENRRKWREARIDSYEIVLEVSGAQNDRYEVRVERGQIVRALYNGRPLDEGRARYWTVPGLFGMIERELRVAEQRKAFPEAEVTIWAAFDPQTGRPIWWQRQVQGAPRTVTIRTRHFRVLSPDQTSSRSK